MLVVFVVVVVVVMVVMVVVVVVLMFVVVVAVFVVVAAIVVVAVLVVAVVVVVLVAVVAVMLLVLMMVVVTTTTTLYPHHHPHRPPSPSLFSSAPAWPTASCSIKVRCFGFLVLRFDSVVVHLLCVCFGDIVLRLLLFPCLSFAFVGRIMFDPAAARCRVLLHTCHVTATHSLAVTKANCCLLQHHHAGCRWGRYEPQSRSSRYV